MVAEERLKISVSQDEGGRTTVFLQGGIDEDASFDAIAQCQGAIVINFKGVTSINSCGVRNWVNFVKSMGNRELFYAECPPLVVKQMNMIPSFVGVAKVDSVYVPYVCDSCDHEKLVLISSDQFGSVQELMKCDSCGEEELEIDGHPDQFFAFGK